MAFPSVTATIDDFERADGALGGDWATTPAFISGGTGLVIAGGRLVYPGAGQFSGFPQTLYGPDFDLLVALNPAYVPADGDALVFGARGHDLGSSDWGGPHLVLIGGSGGTGGTDTWQVRDHPTGGPSTTRDAATPGKLRPDLGEGVGIACRGDQFVAYKVSGGVATEVVRMTTDVLDAGQFFFELAPATGSLDGIDALTGGTLTGDVPGTGFSARVGGEWVAATRSTRVGGAWV